MENNKNKKLNKIAAFCAACCIFINLFAFCAPVKAVNVPVKPDDEFIEDIFKAILTVEPLGGYDTSKTKSAIFNQSVWDGIDAAVNVSNGEVNINLAAARPSFCSEACYLILLKALRDWDDENLNNNLKNNLNLKAISQEAWANLKPYVRRDDNALWPYQDDGMGCWGRANANGPGMAVLCAQLGAGENIYIGAKSEYDNISQYWADWDRAKPGDFLKIFWNRYIGYDAASPKNAESGHMVIYLGRVESYENNTRDDWVYYWSSNGSGTMLNGGYGISRCRASKIYRAVLTRITNPAAFDNAKNIAPDNTDSWLYAIGINHLGTVSELKSAIVG